MAWLELSGIQVYYGPIHAIRGVSCQIEQGQIVGMIGRNGAGKSTTMRAICGLHNPRGGSISFKGERIDQLPAHAVLAAGIAYVPEGRHVFADMSVLDNLRIGAYKHYRAGAKGEAEKCLDKVYGLFPVLRERGQQMAGTLSGGQQQMLAIGRALMSSPGLILLDEPSMGLAPVIVKEVFQSIRRLPETGVTVMLVEQKAFLTLQMVDRAYVIQNGEITIAGTGQELLNNEDVKAAYLGKGTGVGGEERVRFGFRRRTVDASRAAAAAGGGSAPAKPAGGTIDRTLRDLSGDPDLTELPPLTPKPVLRRRGHAEPARPRPAHRADARVEPRPAPPEPGPETATERDMTTDPAGKRPRRDVIDRTLSAPPADGSDRSDRPAAPAHAPAPRNEARATPGIIDRTLRPESFKSARSAGFRPRDIIDRTLSAPPADGSDRAGAPPDNVIDRTLRAARPPAAHTKRHG